MSYGKSSIAVLFAAIAATALSWAGENQCQLRLIASLDMTLSQGGRILVPVSLNGTDKPFLLDTGAPYSFVSPEVTEALGLMTDTVGGDALIDFSGRPIRAITRVATFGLGRLQANQMQLFVSPSPLSSDGGVAGLIGANILKNYDIELDFKAMKLNLFSQDHCRGKVIYWPATTVAAIPMQLEKAGYITIPVKLNDTSVKALLDTGASDTLLEIGAARGRFGLSPGDADTPEIAAATGAEPAYYKHTFDTLAFEGITIGHTPIVIYEDRAKNKIVARPETGSRIGTADASSGTTEMILGMQHLHHFHIFIAYGERMLYITSY